jgi:serine/threonine protein kinase
MADTANSGSSRFRPGQVLGQYALESLLGRGGFSEVWRGHHKASRDIVVAIKIATDPQYARLIRREGALQFKLRHPGVVQIHHFNLESDPPFLVMDLIEGRSLRQVLREKGRLDVGEALRVYRALLDILGYAHGRGVIHRDLKPENILIDDRKRILLTDFGLGKVAEEVQRSVLFSESLRSGDAALVGTFAYMPKEQREGGRIDRRVDIYALGIILFELLTGERPEFGDLPSTMAPEVPEYLDPIFQRSVARIDERFDGTDAVIKALSRYERALSEAPPDLHGLQREPVEKGTATPGGIESSEIYCDRCGNRTDPGSAYCDRCGNELEAAKPTAVSNALPADSEESRAGMDRYCIACGRPLDENARFCIHCGKSVST